MEILLHFHSIGQYRMAYDLIRDIDNTIFAYELSFQKIDKASARDLFLNLRNKFKLDLDQQKLWENNQFFTGEFIYKDDWFDLFIHRTSNFGDAMYLVITEETKFPWTLYYGSRSELPELIFNQIYFEYFVFDDNFRELIFNTHHNSLVTLRRN